MAHEYSADIRATAKRLGVHEESIRLTRYWMENSAVAADLPPAFVLWAVEQALDYQLQYLFNDNRRRAWVKSRQIGGSWTIALDMLLGTQRKRDQFLVSASGDLSREVITKAKEILSAWEQVFDRPFLSKDRDATQNKSTITRDNGKRVVARPASPRTVRGFTGDTTIDECGVIPYDRQIYKAAAAITTRGDRRLSCVGTPFGAAGVFYDVCRGPLKHHFWQHETSIYAAVRDGAPIDIDDIRAQFTSEDWSQEYEVDFLVSGLGFFPVPLIVEAEDNGQKWIEEGLARQHKVVARYMGVDVGRKRDLTAICVLFLLDNGWLIPLPVEVLEKTPFEQQEERIDELFRIHQPERCFLDSTGIGAASAEKLEMRHPGKIIGIDFSKKGVKRTLVEHFRHVLERRCFGFHPGDPDTAFEARLIKREYTKSGIIRYVADRNEDGHADRITGVMLATLAANQAYDPFFAESGPANEKEAAELWGLPYIDPEEIKRMPVEERNRRLTAEWTTRRIRELRDGYVSDGDPFDGLYAEDAGREAASDADGEGWLGG